MGDVIHLPTAPKRKVQQRCNQHLRDFKAANPWPGKYIPPYRRAMERGIAGAERTPELLITLAILKTITPEQRREIQDIVDRTHFACGDDVSLTASALVAGVS